MKAIHVYTTYRRVSVRQRFFRRVQLMAARNLIRCCDATLLACACSATVFRSVTPARDGARALRGGQNRGAVGSAAWGAFSASGLANGGPVLPALGDDVAVVRRPSVAIGTRTIRPTIHTHVGVLGRRPTWQPQLAPKSARGGS